MAESTVTTEKAAASAVSQFIQLMKPIFLFGLSNDSSLSLSLGQFLFILGTLVLVF